MTHFFWSYFARMNISKAWSFCGLLNPSGIRASYTALALALPITLMDWTCSGSHVSKLTDLTREMWTPRFLWIPAQRMQRNTPRFQAAHRGCLASQSAQYLFSSSVNNDLRISKNRTLLFRWLKLIAFKK